MKLNDYNNDYLIGALILLVVGLIALASGYGYSPMTGLRKVSSPIGAFIFFLLMSILVMILNIIYVQLKRHYKKKGKYKEDK